jgi:pimeloyl-ACP methyl ester carboxylesterase
MTIATQKPKPTPTKPHLRATDLRQLARLATDATRGVTSLSEGVHQAVWRTLGAPRGDSPTQTRGLTGFVYGRIYQITALVGKSVDLALMALQPLFESTERAAEGSPQREAVIAALNGVMGDRLAASKNPFATPMTIRFRGAAIDAETMPAKKKVNGKLLLMIHGLCMNDLQWTVEHDGRTTNHGETVAAACDLTPIYLRYNTGLPIAENGRLLSQQLDALVADWPVAITEINILAHSMGGLVARYACEAGQASKSSWRGLVKKIIFLGTPHHGAPLERAGNWIDLILGATPYSAPFMKMTKLRSIGITDLRHGQSMPLPKSMRCYAIAGTVATNATMQNKLIGDGLVPLDSALGKHQDASKQLAFPKTRQMIAYETNHMALLHSEGVAGQLVKWLSP